MGDTPRDGLGEGVAPRERVEVSGDNNDDSPEDCICLPFSSTSSSVNDISRRVRDRTVEVDLRLVFVVLEVPRLKRSAKPPLELIPGDKDDKIDWRGCGCRQVTGRSSGFACEIAQAQIAIGGLYDRPFVIRAL